VNLVEDVGHIHISLHRKEEDGMIEDQEVDKEIKHGHHPVTLGEATTEEEGDVGHIHISLHRKEEDGMIEDQEVGKEIK